MSEYTPDKGDIVFSVSPPNQTKQDVNLCDVSEKDKVWDKHRANSDRVSDYYRNSDYSRYSQRIDECSLLLDFKLSPDVDEGALKLKLASSKFCRVRHCPVCQWRRSMMWKAKA